jgi:hypothetical protein
MINSKFNVLDFIFDLQELTPTEAISEIALSGLSDAEIVICVKTIALNDTFKFKAAAPEVKAAPKVLRRPLTDKQSALHTILLTYMTTSQPMHYDRLKSLSEFSSFDATFNALLVKGHIKRHKEGDGNNTYILTYRPKTDATN